MNNVWWYADPHISHDNILKYCSRPFASIEEHDETLIANHNEVVKKGDRVYWLGDVAFRKNAKETEELMKRFNGQKFLCLGNHDSQLRKNKSGLGFVTIQDVIETKIEGQRIFMSHYAHRVWPASHHGSWHTYGHSHGNLPENDSLSFDVGVDSWNYYPVSWEQIKEKMKAKKEIIERNRLQWINGVYQ